MAVRTWCALASYAGASGAQPALVVAEECYDMAALLAKIEIADAPKRALAAGVDAALAQWALVEPALHVLTAGVARAGVAPLAAPKLLAPYRPSRIFAAAANYSDHAREMGGTPGSRTETEPYFFPKADSAVIGTGATVVKPARVEKLDWEVELAVIIGRGGRDIRASEALAHVAGYSIMNDVSARDQNTRTDVPFKHDWFRGKSWDTFAPFGPWIVPADCIADPQNLRLGMDVSGQAMQNGNTGGMIFNVAEQIAYLSMIVTLRPGDCIITGTPAGVGMGRGVFLKPGDTMRAWIESIGEIVNPVAAPAG